MQPHSSCSDNAPFRENPVQAGPTAPDQFLTCTDDFPVQSGRTTPDPLDDWYNDNATTRSIEFPVAPALNVEEGIKTEPASQRSNTKHDGIVDIKDAPPELVTSSDSEDEPWDPNPIDLDDD